MTFKYRGERYNCINYNKRKKKFFLYQTSFWQNQGQNGAWSKILKEGTEE